MGIQILPLCAPVQDYFPKWKPAFCIYELSQPRIHGASPLCPRGIVHRHSVSELQQTVPLHVVRVFNLLLKTRYSTGQLCSQSPGVMTVWPRYPVCVYRVYCIFIYNKF
jgi:hypothetical protein